MKRTEDLVRKQYEAAGYTVYRNGWPDFLVEKNGVFSGVEVKVARHNGGECVSDAQSDMMTALHRAGISTKIEWIPQSEYKSETTSEKETRLLSDARKGLNSRHNPKKKVLTRDDGLS